MKSTKSESERRERQDWAIVGIILLIGFLCVAVAGQWALRLSPSWELNTDMESNIDPNGEAPAGGPVNFIEPIDPAILTKPPWAALFTPGAHFETRTPLPPPAKTSTALARESATPAASATPATIPAATNTIFVTNTVAPTNTFVWYPPPPGATKTHKPKPKDTPTNTSSAPLPSANLGITQSDGTNTYVAGGTLTYTVTVTNAGPSNVIGATVTDAFTAQVTGASWSCVAVGTTCGAGGPGLINDVVNLPVGSSIIYTINVNIDAGASGNLVHTASVTMPAGYTETNPADNVSTDTNTPVVSADLWITKTDGATSYVAGGTTTYTVTVGNNGPSNITGATVTDVFVQISGATWACGSATGGSCTANGSGNINDSAVNLPVGSSVIYTINATIDAGASGNLVNTASIAGPAGYTEAAPGNESQTDTDTPIIIDTFPGEIGSSPDYSVYNLPMGSSLTLQLPAPVVANGDGAWDLVYYELENPGPPPFVLLDWVVIEISDGHNWYTVYNWGNGVSDTNTNVASFSPEIDEFNIPSGPPLYNNTGVAINVDTIVPLGNYPYIRLTSPSSGVGAPADGSTDIDAITPIP